MTSEKPPSVVPTTAGARSEAAAVKRRELARRAGAANILAPHEVAGDYDSGRALLTTLGSDLARPLTVDDLRAFRRNVATLGKKFHGGITAADVINRSLPIDRQRANLEIHAAIPLWARRGQLHFVTSAGPASAVRRHHVDVVLLEHSSLVAAPKDAKAAARKDAAGHLKFDCDCGRHTFWYRYIATIGHFNAGRDETGYPKIRNPKLRGVACKHVMRVMKQLTSAAVLHQIARMIEADRRALSAGASKAIVLTQPQAQQIGERQHRESGYARNTIQTQAQRRASTRLRAAIQVRRQASAKGAVTDRAKRDIGLRLNNLAAKGGITAAQLSAALSALQIAR
ncbi:MAG: hypothetical protein ISP90_02890 [Nevskia sp.]|nr:hypothetical protein [Nevskia sp.]